MDENILLQIEILKTNINDSWVLINDSLPGNKL